ncbi:fluoride efflux transporter CrcB [Sulfurimonas sp. MAG313]|nr:fluoride efflux transporter CrcB [Sulfurimonas sp. MAG313]MDF1881572.1 fluoride efflux transporter CrcB [Sulfurimonas sp. MAG313]
MNIASLLAIGSGGFIGASLRYVINNYISHHYPHSLPYGILFVNLFGSFIMGVMFALFTFTSIFSHDTRLYTFITTGILGALTTYSTFALDSFILFNTGHYAAAGINMTLNLFGTVFCAGIGFMSISYLLK